MEEEVSDDEISEDDSEDEQRMERVEELRQENDERLVFWTVYSIFS